MAYDLETYKQIRAGRAGFYERKRGLVAVRGKEAVQFLDGLVTNSVKYLEDGEQMLAAFPNAQGRLLAIVQLKREGERFLFDTEEVTQEKVYQNLFRFTFAGDFFVEDLSDGFSYFELFGPKSDVYRPDVATKWPGAIAFELPYGASYFVPVEQGGEFRRFLSDENGCLEMEPELYETLRIESGIAKYGIDADENTVVPELGIDGLISYNKGCYIGQEIIARIHFRGHVAKQLTGIRLNESVTAPRELTAADGKVAGRITSATYSPHLQRWIALAYVRYEHLAPGTSLAAGDSEAIVTSLPFI